MAEKDRVLASLRVWIATAWTDGTLAEPERVALRRLISYAAMPDAYREQASGWLDAPIELEVGSLDELSRERREFIYSVAVALTRVDREVDPTEQSLLERLRDALLIDAEAAQKLE